MRDRDLRLRQFFAGYFNQDWDVAGAKSWADVAATYIKEHPRAQVLTLRDDLRAWLREMPEEQSALATLGCEYDPSPDGIDDRAWVQLLANFFDAKLTN
jgi:hypothetical protein